MLSVCCPAGTQWKKGLRSRAFEDFVQEEVMKGRSILGLCPATDPKTKDEFAAWRKAKGR